MLASCPLDEWEELLGPLQPAHGPQPRPRPARHDHRVPHGANVGEERCRGVEVSRCRAWTPVETRNHLCLTLYGHANTLCLDALLHTERKQHYENRNTGTFRNPRDRLRDCRKVNTIGSTGRTKRGRSHANTKQTDKARLLLRRHHQKRNAL